MNVWRQIESETDTRAMEIPGVGCIVANIMGMCFVPHTRIVDSTLQREDRSSPPLKSGKSAAEIRAGQPLIVDPGSLPYITSDVNDTEY